LLRPRQTLKRAACLCTLSLLVFACTEPSHDVPTVDDDVTPRTAEVTTEDVHVSRSDTALQRRPNADGLTPLGCAPDCSQRALERVNQWRGLLGLSHLTPDPDLQTAAANHTAYYLNHWETLYEARSSAQ